VKRPLVRVTGGRALSPKDWNTRPPDASGWRTPLGGKAGAPGRVASR